jgi:hypothetical protein
MDDLLVLYFIDDFIGRLATTKSAMLDVRDRSIPSVIMYRGNKFLYGTLDSII